MKKFQWLSQVVEQIKEQKDAMYLVYKMHPTPYTTDLLQVLIG